MPHAAAASPLECRPPNLHRAASVPGPALRTGGPPSLRGSLAACAVVWLCLGLARPLNGAAPARDYPVKPVPFTAVHLDDPFWAPRIETNRLVTIPFAFEQCERSGRMDNFVRAAKALRGEPLANRGRGQMSVWIANSEQSVRVLAPPTVASTSRVTASHPGTNLQAVHDQMEPASSDDAENSFFHWWPRKGTDEWVQYTFPQPTTVSETDVYWFDDTGHGECRVPASWRALYRDGDQWKPVESADHYGVAKDQYNRVTFTPIRTTELRLEIKLQPRWSTGIQEWKVK